MARRRRGKTPRLRPVNVKFIVFQIIVLLVFLLALFAVQDTISEGTGVLIDSLASEDLDVQQPVDDDGDTDFPGDHTDDGAHTGPAAESEGDVTDAGGDEFDASDDASHPDQ